MSLTKSTTVFLALWIIISMFYYNIYNIFDFKSNLKLRNRFYKVTQYDSKTQYQVLDGTTDALENVSREDLLINTPGCVILDYGKTMVFKEAANKKQNCGVRAVFIFKLSEDEIIFRIDNEKMVNMYRKGKGKQQRRQTGFKCCYQFVSRPTSNVLGIQDTKVTYSPCVTFKNGTVTKLKQEVIRITCGVDPIKKTEIFYIDVYMLVKKVKDDNRIKEKKWNVLIMGMDTMSRARAFANLPQTIRHFKKNGWLDYRGYQKVGYNTFPNVVAILSGKTNIYSECRPSMDHCNDHFIWSKFKNASFATAYGEDYLKLPDTFSNYGGFEVPPTDHYMRPLFETGESVAGNIICAKKLPSALHILDYAYDFSQSYRDDGFFGMFWINSYSHNLFNVPALFDQHAEFFFEKISKASTSNNTFIIFLSDHGIRYGETRYQMESYYEERLPMFFMWVPHDFRKRYPAKYHNLQVNQKRLATPYDLHATLWEILKMSRESITITKPAACPHCTSLFEEKSIYRTCTDAAVDKKWCSCHKMAPIDVTEADAHNSLELAVSSIINITNNVETIECTECAKLYLKTTLRIHSYYDSANHNTYYVVAFLMSPGNVGYEVTIEKDSTQLKIVHPITTITVYNTKGYCTKNKLRDRPFCVCKKNHKCHKNNKR